MSVAKMIHHVRHFIIGLLCLCAAVNQVNATECSVEERITFVPRELWGAVPPRINNPLQNPVTEVSIGVIAREQCLDSGTCASLVKDIQKYDMQPAGTNHPDIDYNFVIGGDSKVYEGTGWQRYAAEISRHSVKIFFIGTSYGDGSVPAVPIPQGLFDTLDKLLRVGVAFGHITADHGLCGMQTVLTNWPEYSKYNCGPPPDP